jgi:RNA ligase (TIGR02306 family)
MRKLATIRVINQLCPIPGADLIEVAIVDGWETVVKKGEFNVGDLCVYFEIDSWIPSIIVPFLFKGKSYQGVEGARLRTMRLKGQLSQGLALPICHLNDAVIPLKHLQDPELNDVTEILGVLKWEAPETGKAFNGNAKGNFPDFVPKTSQERVQNVWGRHRDFYKVDRWEVTEKLHGSSMTIYIKDGVVGVCSRNLELKEEDGGAFWETAHRQGLVDAIKALGPDMVLQGELCGPGICGNNYKLPTHEFFLFDMYDIEYQEYLDAHTRNALAKVYKIKTVPLVAMDVHIAESTVKELLDKADGPSQLVDAPREGFVYKSLSDPTKSFKVISNNWLLTEK